MFALLSAHPEWETGITCLLRNKSHEDVIKKQYPKLTFFYAGLSDATELSNEASKYDIVLHFAVSSDHVDSASALLKGLSQHGGHYIHTSGMDVLLNPHREAGSPTNVHTFDDWDGIDELLSLPGLSLYRPKNWCFMIVN